MAEINATFVVDAIDLTVVQEDPGITITPDPINLNVYAAGFAQAGGNFGELQYNGGSLQGIPNVTWDGNNLNLGNISNVKIDGGSANYVLTTDGLGNLTFINPTSANIVADNANIGNLEANIANINLIQSSNIVSSNSTIDILNSNNISLTAFNESVNIANISGVITPDVSQDTIFRYTLTGNITINSFANAVAGTSAVLVLIQDGVGSRTLTSGMKFSNGDKVLSVDPNAIDVMVVFYDGVDYFAALSRGYS